jgi:hypothetical protein
MDTHAKPHEIETLVKVALNRCRAEVVTSGHDVFSGFTYLLGYLKPDIFR